MSLQPIFPLFSQLRPLVREGRSYHGNGRHGLSGAFFLKCKTNTKEGKRLISSSRLRERTECTDIYIHVNRWGESDRLWWLKMTTNARTQTPNWYRLCPEIFLNLIQCHRNPSYFFSFSFHSKSKTCSCGLKHPYRNVVCQSCFIKHEK